MMKNASPDKSGNTENLKNNRNSSKAFLTHKLWNLCFVTHIPYNLRRSDLLHLPPAKSTCYGMEPVME